MSTDLYFSHPALTVPKHLATVTPPRPHPPHPRPFLWGGRRQAPPALGPSSALGGGAEPRHQASREGRAEPTWSPEPQPPSSPRRKQRFPQFDHNDVQSVKERNGNMDLAGPAEGDGRRGAWGPGGGGEGCRNPRARACDPHRTRDEVRLGELCARGPTVVGKPLNPMQRSSTCSQRAGAAGCPLGRGRCGGRGARGQAAAASRAPGSDFAETRGQ